MKWILDLVLGPIFGAIGNVFLSLYQGYHERKLQAYKDKADASQAVLDRIKAAQDAKDRVDSAIAAGGLRDPDPNSIT